MLDEEKEITRVQNLCKNILDSEQTTKEYILDALKNLRRPNISMIEFKHIASVLFILSRLNLTGSNISQTAKLIRTERTYLQLLLKKYNINKEMIIFFIPRVFFDALIKVNKLDYNRPPENSFELLINWTLDNECVYKFGRLKPSATKTSLIDFPDKFKNPLKNSLALFFLRLCDENLSLKDFKHQVGAIYITKCLMAAGGDQSKAAGLIGTHRSNFCSLVSKYNITKKINNFNYDFGKIFIDILFMFLDASGGIEVAQEKPLPEKIIINTEKKELAYPCPRGLKRLSGQGKDVIIQAVESYLIDVYSYLVYREPTLKEFKNIIKTLLLISCLNSTDGNHSAAAKKLKIIRTYVSKLKSQLDIDLDISVIECFSSKIFVKTILLFCEKNLENGEINTSEKSLFSNPEDRPPDTESSPLTKHRLNNNFLRLKTVNLSMTEFINIAQYYYILYRYSVKKSGVATARSLKVQRTYLCRMMTKYNIRDSERSDFRLKDFIFFLSTWLRSNYNDPIQPESEEIINIPCISDILDEQNNTRNSPKNKKTDEFVEITGREDICDNANKLDEKISGNNTDYLPNRDNALPDKTVKAKHKTYLKINTNETHNPGPKIYESVEDALKRHKEKVKNRPWEL